MTDFDDFPATGLSQEQISWLLILAHTSLQQEQVEQAVTLLNYLRVFDRDSPEALKMLAWAHYKLGDFERSEEYIAAALPLLKAGREQAALKLLRVRLAGHQSGGVNNKQMDEYIQQIAQLKGVAEEVKA
ncbi:MAG: hypothetical protein ACR2P9_01310 [Gammaproteobacteria bacterium]